MPELVDGLWLQQYVEPQLLKEFKNYKDDFIGVLKSAPASAIDKDGIRFNKLVNNIGFHINRDTDFNPITVPGKKTLVEWDKMDTDPTEVTDAELRAMAFDKEAEIRVLHSDSFKLGVRDYVMQKLAPANNVSRKMPVIRTSGDAVDVLDDAGNVLGQRKKLTYSDMIKWYALIEGLNLPNKDQLYSIICAEHRQDLIDDRSSTNNYRDIEIDKSTGEIKRLFKLKFFENNHNVNYKASGDLVADGAVAENTDRNASIFFYAPNTVYHIEAVKTLYKPMEQDTRSKDPKSEFRLHTYGLCDKRQDHGFGAMVSGIVNP